MLQQLQILWCEDGGQDLVEYTLLICFVVMVAAGILGYGSASIKGIVSTSNSQLTYANEYAKR